MMPHTDVRGMRPCGCHTHVLVEGPLARGTPVPANLQAATLGNIHLWRASGPEGGLIVDHSHAAAHNISQRADLLVPVMRQGDILLSRTPSIRNS